MTVAEVDCEAFFALLEERLPDDRLAPSRSVVGDQCVLECYHPRTVERLGTDAIVTRFNRSGVVWAPRAAHVKVTLRVPATHREAVLGALADAPFPFEVTDHRVVGAPDGEPVTVLHVSTSTDGVSREALEATLDAVGAALVV